MLLTLFRAWSLLLLLTVGASAAKEVSAVCNVKLSEGRLGGLAVGRSIGKIASAVRIEEVELPGESPQSAVEVEFACGARILALLGSESEVLAIVARDSSIADGVGIRVGMSFEQVRRRLPSARVLSGEEEGGYLSLAKGKYRYVFSTVGLEPSLLTNRQALIKSARSQVLEEIRLVK